jgi:predicted nucleic acid-binding protein
MEDGIERSTVNYEEEKDSKREKYVYIFLPSNSNYIIFFDKDKAIEYSQKNNCRVDIFTETENSVYSCTKNYYENGVLE